MLTIEANAAGRDFVLGDVHGRFDTVEAALDELAYSPDWDRLFSLGDLIDFGPRSPDALKWMTSRLTATVRGNHEDMMLDYLRTEADYTTMAALGGRHSWRSRSPS